MLIGHNRIVLEQVIRQIIYVKDSLYLKNLLPHEQLYSQGYDKVLNLMIRIFLKNRQGKPVVKVTLQLQAFEYSVDDMNNLDLPFHENCYEDYHQLVLLGGPTTVECSLSQEGNDMDTNTNNIFDNRSTYYIEALPFSRR